MKNNKKIIINADRQHEINNSWFLQIIKRKLEENDRRGILCIKKCQKRVRVGSKKYIICLVLYAIIILKLH